MFRLAQQIPEWTVKSPQGAFYLFPRYRGSVPSKDLSQQILEKTFVVTTGGSLFGASGEGHLRLSYATSQGEIQKGMERLREFFSLN